MFEEEVVDDAVKAGMFIEFENPSTGDTALIPTAAMARELGIPRREAKQQERAVIEEYKAAGFRRVVTGGRR